MRASLLKEFRGLAQHASPFFPVFQWPDVPFCVPFSLRACHMVASDIVFLIWDLPNHEHQERSVRYGNPKIQYQEAR